MSTLGFLGSTKQNQGFRDAAFVNNPAVNSEHSSQSCEYISRLHGERRSIFKKKNIMTLTLSNETFVYCIKYWGLSAPQVCKCNYSITFLQQKSSPVGTHCIKIKALLSRSNACEDICLRLNYYLSQKLSEHAKEQIK